MIQVKGHKNLYRDDNTGAIINYDQQGYLNYISQKKERENLKHEVQNLKSELSEIKLLLKEIIDGHQKIELNTIDKLFEYEKQSRFIDELSENELKEFAKLYCKLYLKQQEVLKSLDDFEI